jgi:chromosome segregation ATPase
MYDGSIVIGTELSTNKFDKQIADLDRKIDKEEDKKIIIETKLSNQEQELERARQKADELADAYQKIKAVQEKVSQHKASPAEFETMQNLQAQYGSLEKIDGAFQKAISKQDELQLKVQETKNKYEAINNEISQYKQKIESINIQKQKADVDQLKGSIDKVGNSFTGAVKKAGKLALAIFGIRSAYIMLRRASSELATYDEQYAVNLEYIRFVLTQAIAPVLRYIVNLAMQLLGYINAILQAWFGVNLFANGSVEAFQKMKKGATGVGKAVKEIKKQLLGFDEINMLTSQSDTGTQAGAGGVGAMPDFDLSSWQGEVPEWLKWIIDHKDIILSVLAGIATGLTLIKFGMSGIKALGFGLIVTGITLAIQGLLGFIKDPSWKNFGKIIESQKNRNTV